MGTTPLAHNGHSNGISNEGVSIGEGMLRVIRHTDRHAQTDRREDRQTDSQTGRAKHGQTQTGGRTHR